MPATDATDLLLAAVTAQLEAARPMVDAAALSGRLQSVNIFVRYEGNPPRPKVITVKPETKRELP